MIAKYQAVLLAGLLPLAAAAQVVAAGLEVLEKAQKSQKNSKKN